MSEIIKARIDQCTVYVFDNNMMNGLYADYADEDNYAFVSGAVKENRPAITTAIAQGVKVFDMREVAVDWDSDPYMYIVSAMGKLVAESAEQICREASD